MSRWEQIAGKPLEPVEDRYKSCLQSSQIALEQTLKGLVYDCLGWQLENKEFKLKMPRMCWLRENCTVRMQLHRRSGQTTSLIRVATMVFERPVFIFHSINFAKRACKEFGINKNQAYTIGTLRGLIYPVPECIGIDNSSLYDQKEIDYIYGIADQDTKCLIFMG